MNEVTSEHAAKFCGYVANWCEALSLGDWRVVVSDKRSNRRVMAEVYKFDLEQRSASMRLGKHWSNQEVTDAELNKTALHEVLHVFLYELIETAKKDPEDDALSSAEHRVINVLERLLADR